MDAKRDVRGEILRTARELLNEEGVEGLSMREVARRAGVTHQAPYHYFANRDAILAEVIADGFAELAASLAQANDLASDEGSRAAMLAAGQAYAGFALANPGVFWAMFHPDRRDAAEADSVVRAGKRAFGELTRLVRIVHGDDADEALAALYWANVHGLASLAIDGPLVTYLTTPQNRDAVLTAAAERFVDLVVG